MNPKVIVFSAIMVVLVLIFGFGFLRSKPKLVPPPSFTGTPITTAGIGVMGDSISDEYQADNARGGSYDATTFNWLEQLVLRRGLNFGPWGTWGEPRRTGYEYNWARSSATTSLLIEQGQHTGLAKQVAEGKVSIVFLWIGYDDFSLTNGTYEEVYNGSLDDAALQSKVNQMVANITTAVDTVLAAGPVKMVIVTLADSSLAPQAVVHFPNAAGRRRVTNAINQVNVGVENLGSTRGVTVVNANNFARAVLGRVNKLGFLNIGNKKINLLVKGNSPFYLQLADMAGHPGTVASGLSANALFIQPFNDSYDLGIPPLTDEEILMNAGIR